MIDHTSKRWMSIPKYFRKSSSKHWSNRRLSPHLSQEDINTLICRESSNHLYFLSRPYWSVCRTTWEYSTSVILPPKRPAYRQLRHIHLKLNFVHGVIFRTNFIFFDIGIEARAEQRENTRRVQCYHLSDKGVPRWIVTLWNRTLCMI